MDKLTPEHRSWNMSRICSVNTKPELAVRSLLHKMGYRFRLHRKDLPGKPDIVLPKYKTVIFVHGCFWHCHKNCKYAYKPKSRVKFWEEKLSGNADRDKRKQSELKSLGWNVFVIWECELSKQELVVNKNFPDGKDIVSVNLKKVLNFLANPNINKEFHSSPEQ